jgi:rhodanese-related sulfurtransferase
MGISETDALSSIRFSMGRTTTRADITYVLAVLRKVLKADPPGLGYIDPQHLTPQRTLTAFLVDLRWPHERMLDASIPGAQEWTWIHFDRYFKQIPWDREVILMCATGIFSYAAGYRLARAGHPMVKVVFGGYAAWKNLHDISAYEQPKDTLQ